MAVMPTGEKGFNVDNVRCVAGFFFPFLFFFSVWSGDEKLTRWFCVCRVIKIMGDSLSESKVVRGMVFGRESEGVFFPPSSMETNSDQTPRIQARSNMQPQQK